MSMICSPACALKSESGGHWSQDKMPSEQTSLAPSLIYFSSLWHIQKTRQKRDTARSYDLSADQFVYLQPKLYEGH